MAVSSLSLEASLHSVICHAVICRAARFTRVACSSWSAHIVIIRLISDFPVAGRHSASFSPSTRLGRRPRLRLRLRLVRLVSSFRLKGFPFSLGLRRLGKICDDSRMRTAIDFVFLLFPVILGILVILFFHVFF